MYDKKKKKQIFGFCVYKLKKRKEKKIPPFCVLRKGVWGFRGCQLGGSPFWFELWDCMDPRRIPSGGSLALGEPDLSLWSQHAGRYGSNLVNYWGGFVGG